MIRQLLAWASRKGWAPSVTPPTDRWYIGGPVERCNLPHPAFFLNGPEPTCTLDNGHRGLHDAGGDDL